MAVEPTVDSIDDLNPAWPLATDTVIPGEELAKHLRHLKTGVRGSFTDLAANGGAVDASAQEFNECAGLTGNLQTQIDTTTAPPLWTNPPIDTILTGINQFDLVANTRVLVYATYPSRNTIDLMLPPVTGLSDGDVVHAVAREIFMNASSRVRVRLLGGEPNFLARMADGSWQSVVTAIVNPFLAGDLSGGKAVRWPVIKCVYNTTESTWRVWCERSEFNG